MYDLDRNGLIDENEMRSFIEVQNFVFLFFVYLFLYLLLVNLWIARYWHQWSVKNRL